jgi:hypothetical protein
MLLNEFLAGAACMNLLVIALFFVRFWRKTHDRLFIYFAAAFLVLMAERIIRATMETETDWAPYVYSVRLLAFVLILIAIIDKNKRS